MNSDTLANKFAPTLLPTNVLYLHEKAKSVLKHIVEKLTQQLSSDDEPSTHDKKQILQNIVKTNPILPSSWLNKLDNDDETSSSSSPSITTNKKNDQYDSDFEFFN
jgi:hypothetical protein